MESNNFIENIYAAYAARRPNSQKLHDKAGRFMPGGDTRSVTFYRPFPTFMKYGQGFTIVDVDGFKYIDFQNNYNSLIHGHSHPRITEAVTKQIQLGTVYGSPAESQFLLAEELCQRLPGADKIRFCNSGTEATLLAIGLARYITQRYKILKMEGGYHGSHAVGQISIKPALENAGPTEKPHSVPENTGIPPSVLKDCVVAPFNDINITETIIAENHHDLAAIIVEPVAGSCGMIPPEPGFLEMLRETTTKFKIPLIFDEVLSFRLSRGGCQELYGIVPDLTALGKIIGGGFPVGALAGSNEYLNHFAPDKARFLKHSGTFNGNPVTMTAGLAALTELTISEIDRINRLGEKLRSDLRKVLNELKITAQVTGAGSLAQIHFTDREVRDWRSAATASIDLRTIFHLLLLEKGIFTATRAFFNISTPMGATEVNKLTDAAKSSLIEMIPYFENISPHLISD
ncbi:MAG: aspartate aminotransferase family protein [Desulfobacterales bacterium]